MNDDLETEQHYFEAGRRGKPDELEAALANLILARALELVPYACCNIRVSGGYNLLEKRHVVTVSGEVSNPLFGFNLQRIVAEEVIPHLKKAYCEILNGDNLVFDISQLKPQDGVLARNGAVHFHGPQHSGSLPPTHSGGSLDDLAAGDSCAAIAVAYADGPFNLPFERYLAIQIRDILDKAELPGLGKDGKVSVEALYSKGRLVEIGNITVAAQHNPDVDLQTFRENIEGLVIGVVTGCKEQFSTEFDFPGNIAVNTKGPFIQGGWKSDEGQNDAKPHRDGFASYGVCADSFSGEDPTKPEGPLTFLAREIANYVVRNRLAGFAKVYLSVDIGQKEPKTFNIFTNGTNHVPLTKIYRKVREEIPLTYGKMVQRFGLYNPSLYRQIAGDSDYFQNPGLPWNRILAK